MSSRRTFIKLISIAPIGIRIGESSIARAQQDAATLASTPVPCPLAPGQIEGSPEGDSLLPGQIWKAHDRKRPQARKVDPGPFISSPKPPSDSIVLFDGKDLSNFETRSRDGRIGEPKWKVISGYMESEEHLENLVTKQKFGDCQLHLEWADVPVSGICPSGQYRGNSGVFMMMRHEIQVLSSYDNRTYADGQAGSLYGLFPPLVNPCRPEGQWNSYDITFRAPQFKDGALSRPPVITLYFNGILVQDHVELPLGRSPIGVTEESFSLQAHPGSPVRYRNIWIRRVAGYDS
jgi:hypothetical protein